MRLSLPGRLIGSVKIADVNTHYTGALQRLAENQVQMAWSYDGSLPSSPFSWDHLLPFFLIDPSNTQTTSTTNYYPTKLPTSLKPVHNQFEQFHFECLFTVAVHC